jgi:hypothetical protein
MIFLETTTQSTRASGDPAAEWIALDTVETAFRLSDELVELKLRKGDERVCRLRDWLSAIAQSSRHLVPAESGTFLLHFGRSNGRVWTAREPVIAWAIDGSGPLVPVTGMGLFSSETLAPSIQYPDGTVQDVLGLFESFDAWLEDIAADEIPGRGS